jgi:MFS family permease
VLLNTVPSGAPTPRTPEGPAYHDQNGITRAGWRLIWWLSLAQLVVWGTLYYSFSLFILPMEAALGWSKAALHGALTVGLLIAGLCAYPVGTWIDRHGARGLMIAASLAGGLLLIAWSQVSRIEVFFLIWALMGPVHAALLYTPAFAVLTANLGPHYRRAITSMTLVGGFASTVFMPLTQILIDGLGWRGALVALGISTIVPCVAIHAVMLRGTRAGMPAHVSAPGGRSPLRRAVRTRAFWGLLATFACFSAAFSASTFHLIPLLSERGLGMATIVGLIAVIGPMQVAGRLCVLMLGSRQPARVTGWIPLLLAPMSMLLLLLSGTSAPLLTLFVVLYGVANGLITITRGTIVPELLGAEGYGTIMGALTLPVTLAGALSPMGAAALWGVAGYDGVIMALLALLTCALVAWIVAVTGAKPA